jgi:hypothetical protein
MGAKLVAVRLSRASLSLFERSGVEEGREWAVQCHEVTSAIPHGNHTTPAWLHSGGSDEQRRDRIPRLCQEIGVAVICL